MTSLISWGDGTRESSPFSSLVIHGLNNSSSLADIQGRGAILLTKLLCKYFSISSLDCSQSPLLSWISATKLRLLQITIERWKNFEFRSPSLSHKCLDFCLHFTSSHSSHSLSSKLRVASSSRFSFDGSRPCILLILSSISLIRVFALPKTSLFQDINYFWTLWHLLVNLKFYGPLTGMSQAFLTTSKDDSSLTHMALNQNGLGPWLKFHMSVQKDGKMIRVQGNKVLNPCVWKQTLPIHIADPPVKPLSNIFPTSSLVRPSKLMATKSQINRTNIGRKILKAFGITFTSVTPS